MVVKKIFVGKAIQRFFYNFDCEEDSPFQGHFCFPHLFSFSALGNKLVADFSTPIMHAASLLLLRPMKPKATQPEKEGLSNEEFENAYPTNFF